MVDTGTRTTLPPTCPGGWPPWAWQLPGLGWGVLEWPYQLLSELGFQLQRRFWDLPELGAAFRSPLLGVVYGPEKLGPPQRPSPGAADCAVVQQWRLVASGLGQPARLEGVSFGSMPPMLLGRSLVLTLSRSLLGGCLVLVLIPLASLLPLLLLVSALSTALA